MNCLIGSDGRRSDYREAYRRRAAYLLALLLAGAGRAWSADEPDLDDEDAEFVAKTMRVDQKSPIPAPVLSEASKRAAEPSPESARWVMPPLPYRGALTFGHDRLMIRSGSQSSSVLGLSVSGNSFVYAPWLATLNGNAGVTQSRGSDGSEGRSASAALSSNLVPRSRFPGSVSVGAGSSSNSTRNSSTTSEFRTLQWNQAYAPLDQSFRSNWTYSYNQFGTNGGPASRTDALNGSLSLKPGGELPQTLSLTGGMTRAASGSGSGSESQTLGVAHSVYLEDYVLSIASDASASRSEVKGDQGSEYSFAQAGSQFDWIPSDDYPLRLRGGARHQEVRTSQVAVASSERRLATTNLSLNADYPVNRNWAASGTANYLRTTNVDGAGTANSAVASLIGSLSWSGDGKTSKLDAWDYRLGYGGSGSISSTQTNGASGSTGSSSLGLGANLSQGVSRSFGAPGARAPATLSLTQTYSANGASSSGSAGQPVTHSLSHSAAYSWSPVPERPTLAANLSATDSRGFGATRYQYQSLQGTATENLTLSAYESAFWSVGLPLTRQGGGSGGRWEGTVTMTSGYINGRFAKVSGLRYSGNYSLLVRENIETRQTIPSSGQERNGYELEHRFSHSLAWRLGLLSWQLSNDITKAPEAGVSAALRLTVTREFGGVL